jgi:hypothetical protein
MNQLIILNQVLRLDRCPHCNVDKPYLPMQAELATTNSEGGEQRHWRFYACARCGGVITASAIHADHYVIEIFPEGKVVDTALPERAREYLSQAIQTVHAPASSVMVAASAVDAMLKEKGFEKGTLYTRIDEASASGLITSEMAAWAHDVRLDANDQRHADKAAKLPSVGDAKRCIEFAEALGQFLFTLPAMVRRGHEHAKEKGKSQG